MAFLQKQKNLGDLYNLCEAQTNLGLQSMAYQSKNYVTINDGNIHISSFGLKSDNVQSNYVLMATDSNGNAAWRQFTVADWLYKPPEEILLSSFSNDQNFVSQISLETKVTEKITELSSTIIGDSISVSNMNITNFVFNPPIIDNGDGTITNLVDFPCVLTNDTSNVKYSKLIQTYSNNSNVEDVCSSKAVYNLYKYVESIENMQIENTLNANNNLNELQNADLAVRNLGLNDKLNTSNLITHNITNTKEVTNNTVKVAEDEFVLRDVVTGDFKYKPIQFSTALNNPSPYIFVNTASISNLYNNNLLPSIDTKLTTNNVLSEFFENQVLTDLFKERLYQIGIQEVAFSCNYEHLMNKPRDVGSLCNNMGYISSFSNLLELNKVYARSNLQISTVGHTGRFEDLILPVSMSNIFMDENLRNFPGIPFYVKDNFFNELSNSVGKYMARSNLGLGTMSTQNQSNVEILGGTAILKALDVGHDFSIKSSNPDIILHSQSNDYHFLRCIDALGKAEWDQIPFTTPKEDDSLCVRGLTFLTNNLHYNDSNYAISAWAISNVFNNNDRISNLVPIATKTKLGIVRVSSNYLNDPDTSINHLVFTVEGASNLYSNVSFTIETLSNDLTTTIETLSNDLTTTIETLSNDLTTTIETLSNDLTTTIETLSNEVYTEITDTQREINDTLTPNINQRIKTVTYSNVIVQGGSTTNAPYPFITTSVNDDPENKTLNIEATYPGNADEFLCGTGKFETVTKTTLRSNHEDPSKLEGDIVFTGNVVFHPDLTPQRVHFPETVLVGGDGISVSGTEITNTGVRDVYSHTDLTNSGLFMYNNTLVNTGVVEVDESSFLRVLNLNTGISSITQKKLTMNFQFSNFQNYEHSFYSNNSPEPIFGFVKQPENVNHRNDQYLLTGNGTWKSFNAVIDTVSSITLSDGNVGNVLYIQNTSESGTTELTQGKMQGNITLSFSNADPGQVLTYGINYPAGGGTEYRYTWSYIHENAYRLAKELYSTEQVSFDQIIEGSNYIYYADGQFRLPGEAKDFSISTFQFEGCNIRIIQTLDATIPTGVQNNLLQVTHENIGGLPENYLERQYLYKYDNTRNRIFKDNGPYSETLVDESVVFDDFQNRLGAQNEGNTVLTTKALNKYINLFRNDIILEDDTDAFDDTRCLSAMRTSNYMSNVLFNHICLNEDYGSFTNALFYDPNITYDIRNQCITPYTLSNFAYKHLVAQKEKTTNDANPHMSTNETKVITGGTLSNYVQEQISYNYESMTISNRNKFVRGSNLIKFNDDNRWASNVVDAGDDRRAQTDLNDNVKFITPRGTRQIQEIDLQSTDDFDNSAYSYQIVTGHSLSNYVHGHIIYDYNSLTVDHRNKFVRGSNLIKFNDDNRWASNVVDAQTDLNDNVKFITPRGTRQIQEIDLQSTDDFDNSVYSYQIVTGHSLSNYVNHHIIYDYNEEIYTNINKFVRGSNLIKFNDDNRWASNVLDAGVDRRTDLNDNVKFITPLGTRQIREIDLQSDADFDDNDEDQNYQIVTGYSLSNYVRNVINLKPISGNTDIKLLFENNNLVSSKNYPTASNIVRYLRAKNYMNYDDNVLTDNLTTPMEDRLFAETEKDKILSIGALSNLLYPNNTVYGIIVDQEFEWRETTSSVDADTNHNNRFSSLQYSYSNAQVLSISSVDSLIKYKIQYFFEIEKLSFQQLDTFNNYADKREYLKSIADVNYFVSTDFLIDLIDNDIYNELKNQNSNNIVSSIGVVPKMSEIDNTTVYSYTHDSDVSFQGILLHNALINDNQTFVTTNLLHEYVTNTVLYERETKSFTTAMLEIKTESPSGGGKLYTDNLYIRQNMIFFPENTDRVAVELEKKYMTVKSSGEVVFKQIEYLSGHTSNIVREIDEYSMVTGLMTQTSYDNQFVCGMYNHSNTVYVRNGYDIHDSTNSVFVVGTGTNTTNGLPNLPDPNETANGLEVHTNGEVYVRSNLILGNNWRLSFTDDELRIEKLVYESPGVSNYIQKHVFN